MEEFHAPDAALEPVTTAELVAFLEHTSAFLRARALGALARRFGSDSDDQLDDPIAQAIAAPHNHTARTVGTVTVSQFGLAVLLATGKPGGPGTRRRLPGRLAARSAARTGGMAAYCQSCAARNEEPIVTYYMTEGQLVSRFTSTRL